MSKSKAFVQTKLNFGPPVSTPTTAKSPSENCTSSLEEKVGRLKLGSKHPPVCPTPNCKRNGPRVTCTSIKADRSPCMLSWCEDCLCEFSSERFEDIKVDKVDESAFLGVKEGTNQWTCPVCRKLCQCSFCIKPGDSLNSSKSRRPSPFGKTTASVVQPPAFSPISLVYPEEEIWTRLQIREFIFQFGQVCQLEPRVISSLQNVQGDWRIRRLSAILVWQALWIIANFSCSGTINNNSSIDPEIQRLARQKMNEWAASLGLSRTAFPDTNDRLERGGELLSKKGITCDKWQDVAELLAMANFTNLPIPTVNAAVVDALDVAMDDDISSSSMDFEDEQDTIDYQIRTFRALKRSPLSTQEELHLVEMLFDLVLLDGRVRQQIMEATKHLKTMKDFKLALDLQRRQLHLNEKLTITTLMNHTDSGLDMKATSDRLDKEELDTLVATIRSDKRLSRLATPWDENEYWLFHDLLSPQQHIDGVDKQHSRDSYWAHGVIMIGSCPTRKGDGGETQDKQQQQQQRRGWWYLEGVEDMRKLVKWLTASLAVQRKKGAIDKGTLDITENDIKLFQIHLGRRMEYLGLLDRVAY